jgi:hypothetical protein
LITPASDDISGPTRVRDETPACCSFSLPLRLLEVIALSRFSSISAEALKRFRVAARCTPAPI